MSTQLRDTATKSPFSILSLVDTTWTRFSEALFKTGYLPVARLAETAVVAYESAFQLCRYCPDLLLYPG
jgi:cyclopropane-fatty-acyl-phospholipid synthase